jgi:hypothetical protein
MQKVSLDFERKKPKPPAPGSREEIQDFLMASGFGGLDDPDLIHQLAYFVQDHTHFKEIILACKPPERIKCYDAMKPYLRFEAKAFYEYLLM